MPEKLLLHSWYGELIDISENSLLRWDVNVRVDATELGGLLHLLAFFINFQFCLFQLTDRGLMFFFFCPPATYTRKSNGFLGHKRQLAITIISVMVTLFLVCLIAYICVMKKRKTKGNKITSIVLFTQTQRNIYVCVYILNQESF